METQINTAAASFPDVVHSVIREFQIRRKKGGEHTHGKSDAKGFPLPFLQSARIQDLIRDPLYVINSTGMTDLSSQTADLYFEVAAGEHNRIMATWLPYDLSDHVAFLKHDKRFLTLVLDGFLTIIPKSIADYLSVLESAHAERERVYTFREFKCFEPFNFPVST